METTQITDELKTHDLKNKVAIVTGAGRGIGQAISLAYAQAGAAVCCAARTQAEISNTVGQIEASGGLGLAVQADVTQPDTLRQMVAATQDHFGGVDILVVNAGVNLDRNSVEESKLEEWQGTLDINLTGAYNTVQAAIPALKARGGGKIIMIGSGMGHNGRKKSSAYCGSKAGLWMLTRVLGQELWPDNISVNELVPGPVNTAIQGADAQWEDSVFSIDGEWIKTPDKVAPMALFLATQPHIGPTAQSFSLMRRDG